MYRPFYNRIAARPSRPTRLAPDAAKALLAAPRNALLDVVAAGAPPVAVPAGGATYVDVALRKTGVVGTGPRVVGTSTALVGTCTMLVETWMEMTEVLVLTTGTLLVYTTSSLVYATGMVLVYATGELLAIVATGVVKTTVDGMYADEWLCSLVSTNSFKPCRNAGWGVMGGIVHDGCCVDRLGHSARAVGDRQDGRLEENIVS